MALTNAEFEVFLRSKYGILLNEDEGCKDYKIKGFVPVGNGVGMLHKGKPSGLKCILDLFEDMGYTTGAEIGVYKGQLSDRLCSRFSGTIYSIDPWMHFSERIYSDSLTANATQEKLDSRYSKVAEMLSKYPNSVIIRKTSVAALSFIERESLDFVYIDANHRHDFVWHDIRGWWEKIKHGGILSGHDFCLVNRAVVDFCNESKRRNVYCDAGLLPPKLIPYDGGYSFWRDEDWLLYKE